MAHYAFLDQNNIVTEVIVGKDENEDGIDWEHWYGEFRGQVCKRTSYNTKEGVHYKSDNSGPSEDQTKAYRKNYAGIGYIYDEIKDAFIPPQPYPSWHLDANWNWQAPVPYPNDGKEYYWDEANQEWIEIQVIS
jgi:hypothetical protein